MSKIKSKETKLEKTFRKLLLAEGIGGFRKYPNLIGNPDIVLPKYRLAIFVDGGFWHGWNFPESLPRTRKKFWRDKIKRNMERDNFVNRELRKKGWYVLRFWDHEIKKSPKECVEKIRKKIEIIKKTRSSPIIAIDFFCGAGGMTRGLTNAGIGVVKGLDIDESARKTFEENNPGAIFVSADIRNITADDIMSGIRLNRNQKLLFSACAPCQPFSQQNKKIGKEKDDRKPLMIYFSKMVEEIKPDYVFIENVPGLSGKAGIDVYEKFKEILKRGNYSFEEKIVNAKNYGIPQNRRRLVLIAAKNQKVEFPPETHGKGKKPFVTVRDTIGKYPKIKAGENYPPIPNHVARSLTKINLERLKNTPKDGGGRKNWPDKYVLNCHRKRRGYEDVYGRMKWDTPAPTLTCKCTSISNGRFGHPEQDRAISLREAAALQTFEDDYIFYGSMSTITKHIGNAVPVKLAELFGREFIRAKNKFIK